MKSARFNRLLASTALGLVLVLGSHAGNPQEALAQQSEQQIQAAVPMPDTDLLPPLTAKDVASTPSTPSADIKAEPKQDAAAPAAEPAKAAAAPAATPASATADSAVADQLREMISGKLDRIVSRKADREGVESFYKARDYKPLWVSDGAADERAKAAIAYLAQVDSVGLDPNDYPTPDFKSAVTANAQAEAELKLTAAVLTYARQAQIGRIHFSRVGADIEFKLVAPEPAEVLAKLADANDAGAALDSYNPPQAEFKALKAKLAELRKGGSDAQGRGRKEAGPCACRRRQDPAPRHERPARRATAQAPQRRRRQGQSAL